MKVRASDYLFFVSLCFAVSTVNAADMPMDHTMGHAHGSAADEIVVQNPYARAVATGQANSAMFMTVMNHGKTDHAIVSASGTVAKAIELHNHVNEGGMMRMRPVDKIDVKAGGMTQLQPGGLHVMLIGLNQPLQEGDTVNIELKFEDGSTKMVMAPVKNAAPASQGGDMPMGEHKHNM